MRNRRGFTLVETLMVISLIGILATLSLLPVGDTLDQAKYDLTLNQMRRIRGALLGELNPTSLKSGFGYAGDLGALPTAGQGLSALWALPSGLTSWQMNSSNRMGSGWNGPYLVDQGVSGVDYSKDAWGTPYVYDPDSDPATLISYGADRTAGGTELNADITLTLPRNRFWFSVHGLMLDKGSPYGGSLEVEIHVPDPDTGGITSKLDTIQASDQGAFLFEKITPGIRSLTFYLPTQASPSVTYGPYIITVDQPHTLVIYGTAAHPLDLTAAP